MQAVPLGSMMNGCESSIPKRLLSGEPLEGSDPLTATASAARAMIGMTLITASARRNREGGLPTGSAASMRSTRCSMEPVAMPARIECEERTSVAAPNCQTHRNTSRSRSPRSEAM
jgi:hypothetical protein